MGDGKVDGRNRHSFFFFFFFFLFFAMDSTSWCVAHITCLYYLHLFCPELSHACCWKVIGQAFCQDTGDTGISKGKVMKQSAIYIAFDALPRLPIRIINLD